MSRRSPIWASANLPGSAHDARPMPRSVGRPWATALLNVDERDQKGGDRTSAVSSLPWSSLDSRGIGRWPDIHITINRSCARSAHAVPIGNHNIFAEGHFQVVMAIHSSGVRGKHNSRSMNHAKGLIANAWLSTLLSCNFC
jgi:hypothetical protein